MVKCSLIVQSQLFLLFTTYAMLQFLALRQFSYLGFDFHFIVNFL